MPAISLEGVSKKYRIYPHRRDRLREALSLGRSKRSHDFWALRDIDLKVDPGVSLGLLGRNGAGKSTLLQVIAGVLQPSTGSVMTDGRISALLQLGAGFNREFTGRENAVMNGLLLGIERRQMLRRMDEIEAFADIGEFMDQPVKNYSSGMRARLGFAVAVNVEPDILLVDETLSVGDGVFRAMGIQKMRELQESGATIVFVSHSTKMVRDFCTEAALLQKGNLVLHGDVGETADYYEALLSNAAAQRQDRKPGGARPSEAEPEGGVKSPDFEKKNQRDTLPLRHGTGEAKIHNVEILNSRGEPASLVAPDSTMIVRVHLQYEENVKDGILSIAFRNRTGLEVFATNTNLEKTPIKMRRAGDRIVVDFKLRPSLRHGPYSVATAVSRGRSKDVYLDWIGVATTFEIAPPTQRGAYLGMVHLPTEVTIFEQERADIPDQSA
jgi:ABC-type polysaccharide/polyol phosphate transport system ATPase subunit